jgi:hypothetical protein
MRGQLNPPGRRHSEVAEQLAVEFAGLLPRGAIYAEVEVAEHELRGQVPPGSLDEMLHQLAGQRLRECAEGTTVTTGRS